MSAKRNPIRLITALALAISLAACGQSPLATDESSEATVPAPGANLVPCPEIDRRVTPEECEDFTRIAKAAKAGVAAFTAPDPMERGETHTLQLALSFPRPAPPPPTLDETTTAAPEPHEPPTAAPAPDEAVTGEPPSSEPETAPTAEEVVPTIDAPKGDDGEPETAPPTPSETVAPVPGKTEEYQPLVGRFMRAELTGVGFDIEPTTPAQQEVLKDSVTLWQWRVVAREAGLRTLTVTTVIEGCSANGTCYPLRRTTHNQTVTVTVGPLGQAKDFLTALPNWLKLVTAVVVALAALVGAVFGLRNVFRRGRGE